MAKLGIFIKYHNKILTTIRKFRTADNNLMPLRYVNLVIEKKYKSLKTWAVPGTLTLLPHP